jgi:glycosyltransferase involved in cell wall biosynthesis
MKIAFVTDSYIPIPTGVAVSIESLKTTLTRLGHDVYIFAPDYPGWSVKEERVIRLPALYSPFNSNIPARWPIFGVNSKKIKALDLDIVHSHYFFKTYPLSVEIATSSGCPLLHTFYRIFNHDMTVKYSKACDRIIALSRYTKKNLQDMNISTPIDVLPVGIFTKDYASYPPKAIKKKFDIPEGRKMILCPIRLDNEAEFIFLLKSFKNIWRAIDDVHLLVVGGGEKLKYCFELASKQSFGKYITFTGFLPKRKLNKIYGACDLTIYPKREDPQPLVVVESIAAGTPVVAVRGQGAQDFIENHHTGYITNFSIEDFSEKIIDILRRDTLRVKFRQNCRAKSKRFSTSILTRDLVELYKQEITNYKNKF